jgi:transcriptional regulator of NAD metabolism
MKKIERKNLVIGKIYHTTSGEIHSKLKFEGKKDRQILFSLIETSAGIEYIKNTEGFVAFNRIGSPFYI